MKKTLNLILGIVLISGTMISCKKGENDPTLSLTSRKARVSGEWVLASSERTLTSTDTDPNWAYSSTDTYSHDGTQTTHSFSYTSGGNTSNGSEQLGFTQEITINKDGTFSQTISGDDDLNGVFEWSIAQTGTWVFLNKNKSEDLKNKEAISLFTSSEAYTSQGAVSFVDVSTYSGYMNGDVLLIDRLKNKEMVVMYDRSESGDTYFHTDLNKMSFTKK